MGRLKNQLSISALACLTPLVAGLLLAGCATSNPQTAPASPSTELKISISFDGKSVDNEYHLQCRGARATESSTLPNANDACELLAKNPELLTSKPSAQQTCTEIYGGPATAKIKGKIGEQRVQADFDRHNGCAISIWDSLAPLLGEGLR
ncbi:MAG TPA: hypothetical protein DCY59_09080 [Micrococcaceae bacterium]|nr:hypothetical protein [Micrococcaceae bacterium]